MPALHELEILLRQVLRLSLIHIYKADPFTLTEEDFVRRVAEKSCKLSKALYTSITGLSPIASEEICHLASLDSDRPATSYEPEELIHLYRTFGRYLDPVREGGYEPSIYYEGKVPVEDVYKRQAFHRFYQSPNPSDW